MDGQFPPVPARGAVPRGREAEVVPRLTSASLLGRRRQDDRPVRPQDLRYARTGPNQVIDAPPRSSRKREVALAAAAIAVVGAMSGAAALLPSNGSAAEAAQKVGPVTAPMPTASPSKHALRCFRPPRVTRALREAQRLSTAPSTSAGSTSAGASASASSTPSASSLRTRSASASTSPSTRPPSAPTPAGGGTLPAAPGNLGAGTYTLRDFSTQSSGAMISGGVLRGAGIGRTVLEMARNSSSRASAVPGNGNNQGGLANPVNPLYLLRGVNHLENVTVQGSAQGHLYNGVYLSGANIVVRHAEINGIPGNSHANPGETFAVNVNRATGTNTIDDLTINGGSGPLASAAGLAINNSDSTWNISGLTTRNLAYSAGIALWQVRGTFNVHNYVQTGGARSLGAERMAGDVNLYDPVWSAGTTGHDVTYTWDGGFTRGSINFHYSSAAKVPNRKIVVITNHAAGIAGSVHVFVGGVEQPAGKYVTVN